MPKADSLQYTRNLRVANSEKKYLKLKNSIFKTGACTIFATYGYLYLQSKMYSGMVFIQCVLKISKEKPRQMKTGINSFRFLFRKNIHGLQSYYFPMDVFFPIPGTVKMLCQSKKKWSKLGEKAVSYSDTYTIETNFCLWYSLAVFWKVTEIVLCWTNSIITVLNTSCSSTCCAVKHTILSLFQGRTVTVILFYYQNWKSWILTHVPYFIMCRQ